MYSSTINRVHLSSFQTPRSETRCGDQGSIVSGDTGGNTGPPTVAGTGAGTGRPSLGRTGALENPAGSIWSLHGDLLKGCAFDAGPLVEVCLCGRDARRPLSGQEIRKDLATIWHARVAKMASSTTARAGMTHRHHAETHYRLGGAVGGATAVRCAGPSRRHRCL